MCFGAHHKVGLIVRLCSFTAICNPSTKQVLSPLTLTQIVNQVSTILYGSMYKALFLLAFHGFFRISNLLSGFLSHPVTSQGGTLPYHPWGFSSLKWTKTLQASRDQSLIALAAIPGSTLCPIQTVIQLNLLHLVPITAPMFSHMIKDELVVVTQTQVHKILSTMLITMGLNPSDYGFQTQPRLPIVHELCTLRG